MNTPNELSPELVSLHGLNFSLDKNSSARNVMFGSHFSQRLAINGATEKRIQTGVEQDLAKYTFSIKMPCDGQIIKIIHRYPARVDRDFIPANPEIVVIYEDHKTKELGCFSIPGYTSFHQYFGFKYEHKPAMNLLVPGMFIEKDTIFADSPSVGENGGYMYGIELNMAFMSHPAVSEDGILISRDVLDRLKFKIYETRVVEFGSSCFPLNLYGNLDNYKPFPEIGEEIREDGILMMLRDYDYDLVPVAMSRYDAMEPDFIFDKAVYVRGPKGKIVDIRVFRDNPESTVTPSGMMDSMEKYSHALTTFYKEIIDAERQISMDRKKKFNDARVALKPELHRLIVEGLAICGDQYNRNNKMKDAKTLPKLNKVFRKAPVDDYRIEFVIEYELTPTNGFKLSASHGDKGVICHIAEPHEMPVDKNGVRADVIMDANSTFARMNIGRLYEHYFGACAMEASKNIRQQLGIPAMPAKQAIKEIKKLDPALVNNTYNYVLGFYDLISPRQLEFFSQQVTQEERLEHLSDIIDQGIYIYYPIDNPKDMKETVKAFEANPLYRPLYDTVTYTGFSGNKVITESPVRIAPLYLLLLEKITDDWSSVSSGKLQHFGVLSPMTKSEKYAYPFRNAPVRAIGETEGRIFAGYCGREGIAEMMDRSNNPITHRHIIRSILAADRPMDIDRAVDRNKVPLGNSKPLQLVRHISVTHGWKTVYEAPETKKGQ